ncbi:bacteriocin fulvocin C-related protein [Fodinicola feengrottensis]|uniref:Uncharacterized protein n=1 Tax=Fodinicola feengrottensis TaxID=435914 RepID=A0ABN2J5K8_9ACTN|nr:bacteriocin fulvocin C-related protein [Fodinicola feengrottensis]
MNTAENRWILAFDASCGTCREISQTVEAACGGRLEVLPLGRTDVVEWRKAVFGADAAWAPTLISVGQKVRAWTGARMSAPLARRLGPRSTVRVLSALGQLKQNGAAPCQHTAAGPALSRGSLLRLGAGIGIASTVILLGRTPAFAQRVSFGEASRWVATNAGDLPRTYDEIVAHSQIYRKAIYRALGAADRAGLWTEQLTRYRTAHHTELSVAQKALLDQALATFTDASIFEDDAMSRPEVLQKLKSLEGSARSLFGDRLAFAIFASLGPGASTARPGTGGQQSAVQLPGTENVAEPPECDTLCECSVEDDWCTHPARYCRLLDCAHCKDIKCTCFQGCGFAYQYQCDGYCNQTT